MDKEILETAALVDRLRREDTDFRVFGAHGHNYRIGPTISEAEIREFEQKHEIILPEDYRLWLQLVGDGSGRKGRWPIAGVGPSHGIYHLRDTTYDSLPRKPFAPFPVRRTGYQPESRGFGGIFEVDLEDDGNQSIGGVLTLGTKGCACDTLLVVNGQERGKIWQYAESEYWTHGFTFSSWMRDWAERALPRVVRERVTDAVEVGMTRTQAIEICGEEWEEKPWGKQYRHLRLQRFGNRIRN